MDAHFPENEEQRLAELESYVVVDVLSGAVFDRLAGLVARLFAAPFSAISVIDRDTQHIKASNGLDISEIPRSCSFCAHTILSDQVMVVPDALEDERFRTSPLVTGSTQVRFYAGVPLRTPGGANLGTLCIMDTAPRELDQRQIAALRDLAGMAMAEVDLWVSGAKTIAAAEDSGLGDDRYRELFENASDVVYTHDLQGNFTSVNKAAQRITGYSRDDALKMNIVQVLEPESQRLTLEMIQQKLGGAPQTTYEVTIVTKDNRRVILEVSTRLLFRKGIPIGVQGIARDITERKRAEAQLRLLKSVVVNSNDGVMVAEAEPDDPLSSQIVYVNEAFSRITGYSAVESANKTPRILHGPKTDAAVLDKICSAVRRWEPARVELIHYRKDGSEFWVDLNIVPILDERGSSTYWVSVLRETTDRKRAELLERDRNQVLELVASNGSLETVLARLAHLVENQRSDLLCSILLVRDGRLRHGAAPSLPQAVADAFEGLDVTTALGPCEAALLGKPLFILDLTADPLFRREAGLLRNLGLRSCWCVPILSGEGRVLGVFVIYLREQQEPSSAVVELMEMASRLAAVAVDQRALNDRLAYQALHDALTGLPNRFLFEERLHQALDQAKRHGWHVAVLFIDLDRFKQINDTLGHAIGDTLLQLVSRRFEGCLRRTDSLGRMGGDEFQLILTELRDPSDATRVAQKLLDALKAPFKVDAFELFVSASIGISIFPRDGRDSVTLLRNADNAMYRAKNQGKNVFQFFTPDLAAAALEQLELENALRRSMGNGELQLYYQPQLAIGGRLAAVEALLVWNHPKLGVIPPAQFIPVAEESGLIVEIGAWVLEEACRQTVAWRQAGYEPVKVAVNVSPVQFARADFVETVAQVLSHSSLDPSLLELELTESVVMRDFEESSRQMERLRALGASISIDDFGTGYSSLSYLRRLPIDTIKIDRSFVKELDVDSNTMPLVQAIVSLAHGLRLDVVAEGVETEHQMRALRTIGCDKVQGYLLSAPLPASQIEAWLVRSAEVRS
jgi:diguanylate cyclase (GGDEF)-like protein/PAS domain S-box-containing protein